jgi:flagellar hook-associated protein 2
MGRIQSSVGLISGIDSGALIEQLLAVSARPKQSMEQRLESLTGQRQSVTELMTLLIGLQLTARQLGQSNLYASNKVNSSEPRLLQATRTGMPVTGSYRVEVLQLAQRHQAISGTFASANAPLGSAARVTIGHGQAVDDSLPVEQLNGGAGLGRGSLRITDRAGTTHSIDLRRALTVSDIVREVQRQTNGKIAISAHGDAFRIDDLTGGGGRLQIREHADETIASSLGLAGIDTDSSQAFGNPAVKLGAKVRLSALFDGRGLPTNRETEIHVRFRDGTEQTIEIGDFSRPASFPKGSTISHQPNAGLTFQSQTRGGTDDGLRVRFFADPAIQAGNEQVQLVEAGDQRQLIFRIASGQTKASQIVDALARDPQLSKRFSAFASGDGQGIVSEQDRAILAGGAAMPAPAEPTMDDLLSVLNRSSLERLRARISDDGLRIELQDLTVGSSAFEVMDSPPDDLAARLGIAGRSATGLLSGARLVSGLEGVLLSSLGGGPGMPPLTSITVRTRDGQQAEIDLSRVETLADLLSRINGAGLPLSASYNHNGDGISLRDRSQAEASSFRITSADGTADALGIRADVSDSVIEGYGLARRLVDRHTRIGQLNGGLGVSAGRLQLTTSAGTRATLQVDGSLATVGDLLNAIDDLRIGVSARVNDSGDGLLLLDQTSGSGQFSVTSLDRAATLADLGWTKPVQTGLFDGKLLPAIDGSPREQLSITSSQSLNDVAAAINARSSLASASVLTDGQGRARLQIISKRDGREGRLQIDDARSPLGLASSAEGRDALLAIGDSNGELEVVRSPDNVFENAIAGISLTAVQSSTAAVQIDVTDDPSAVASALQRFVTQYNQVIDKVAESTKYDPATGQTGPLFGSSDLLRLQSELGRLLSGRINGPGDIRTLAAVGLKLEQTGKLTLDASRLATQQQRDPQAIERLFATTELGFAARADRLVDQFAAAQGGLLINRSQTLNTQIDALDQRITSFEQRLDRERARLLKQFTNLERVLARIQANSSFLSRIQATGFASGQSLG